MTAMLTYFPACHAPVFFNVKMTAMPIGCHTSIRYLLGMKLMVLALSSGPAPIIKNKAPKVAPWLIMSRRFTTCRSPLIPVCNRSGCPKDDPHDMAWWSRCVKS